MKILGINGGESRPNGSPSRPINDGSAALFIDGQIACATIEERHTRERYAEGFQASAAVCLKSAGLQWPDLDAIAFTTCCDERWTDKNLVVDLLAKTYAKNPGVDKIKWSQLRNRIIVLDHHESHAMLSFIGAGVERALVAILDGMGNRLGPPLDGHWWHAPFQRHSYYLASWVDDRVRLELVDTDCTGPEEVGIGEAYRAITHFFGWDSYQYAGKTMALAAFGNPNHWPDLKFISIDHGRIVSSMKNRHDTPVDQVLEVIAPYHINLAPMDWHRTNGLPPANFCHLVAAFQAQVEAVLVERLTGLCDRYGVRNLCVAGGVAMNCLAMGRLAYERPDFTIYIPSAPSDTGQGLGNALWAAFNEKSPFRESVDAIRYSGLRTAALGLEYPEISYKEACANLASHKNIDLHGPFETEELGRIITDLIERGLVIGVRQGRSEYGPRALGQASVLADPRRRDMPDRINTFKRREKFRPYAPAILQEHAENYFEPAPESPFMSFAGKVRPEKRFLIPAVVHADGTARYQTVDKTGPILLRKVLEEFYRRTGIPVLLNTSFNRAGEPIVETPGDAALSFLKSELDALCLGPYIALKQQEVRRS